VDEGCSPPVSCSNDTPCTPRGLVCNENWGICVVPACTGQPNFTPCETVTSPDRSYDICVNGTCVSPGCGDATCNAPGPNWTLADTSQRLCYDATTSIACPGTPGTAGCETTAFCGQDAQYGWDTTHVATDRFTRTGTTEPIVTDNVTGLVWQGCSRGQSASSCTGSATTGDWGTALSYCDGLTWGAFSDWRLPDDHQLLSIVDFGRSGDPRIDTLAFPSTPGTAYWSSSSYAGDSSSAFAVYFNGGYLTADGKVSTRAARCVRGGPATVPLSRFARTEPVSGFPVVADAVTGLVWQGCAAAQTGASCTGAASTSTWQAALDYCQDSTWAGFTDWYLPNVDELHSIVDNSRASPSIDPTVFPAVPLLPFWSSSSFATDASSAWHVSFGPGTVMTTAKTTFPRYARCVRRP
jgi:hypothetical protein